MGIEGVANMATQLSQAKVQANVDVLVAKKALDIQETVAAGIVQLISPEELNPQLGRNLNIKL
ncbi:MULTISPECIES: YjfB family protein [Bacillus cereus group]|uniref:YjfB family protein n=1 Tax=Bacillus cereus group TaxID=86661 RepID=UPI0022E82E29|nr:YjfB family protein [Bacillus cereus group sp. TH152-1LC]MDA1675572.1 YjfB family protein [Bacillus cereus group sp. TH152-1LC]